MNYLNYTELLERKNEFGEILSTIMTTCASEKNILRKLKLLKQYSIKTKIASEKNNMKQLYKTFDGLLNIKK